METNHTAENHVTGWLEKDIVKKEYNEKATMKTDLG